MVLVVSAPTAAHAAVTPPDRTIIGADTGMSDVRDVAVDASGAIYVATGTTVPVFAPGADGNATPVRVIAGAATTFGYLEGCRKCQGVRVGREWRCRPSSRDQRGGYRSQLPVGHGCPPSGELYVANHSAPSVTVYSPTASGDAAPVRTIVGASTELSRPYGVAVGSTGDIVVANYSSSTINVYVAGADGDVAPYRNIQGAATEISGAFPFALDAAGNVYAGNYNNDSITVYGSVPLPPLITELTPSTGTVGVVDVVVSSGGELATLADSFTFAATLAATGADPVPTGLLAMSLVGLGVALFLAQRRRLQAKA